MDYFSVIVLVIVIFVFISDKNVKSIDKISKETNADMLNKIQEIKNKIEIIKVTNRDMEYARLKNIVKDYQDKLDKKYLLFQNEQLELNTNDINTLIANYINTEEKICGFNTLYKYSSNKWSLKTIYIDLINYLNIFNKNDLSTYGVIICKKEDFLNEEKTFKSRLVSYAPSDVICIHLSKNKLKTKKLNRLYIEKIGKADLNIMLKIFLLIISGSLITTNLIASILNITKDATSVILPLVIYYCYSYIIRYIYKPIGRKRVVATYIFPVYFLIYIIVGIYSLCTKVIKKVHAS